MLRRRNHDNASQKDSTSASPVQGNPVVKKSSKQDTKIDEKFELFMIILLFVIRIGSAFYDVINDCDEVYNYWEPLHLFLYGEGFETWEYSPVYAIRSYFYICLHYIPAWFISFFYSKTAVFLAVRISLALMCAIGEFYAYCAISDKLNKRAAWFYLVFSVFSSGVFLSCSSFLPSSFCMSMTFYIIGAFIYEHWSFGIFCVAFSTLVGWPFSAVIGLPFVIQMLFLRDLKTEFILPAVFSGMGIGTVQFLVDTYFFGKPVVASLNIVLYNVLSGPGPSLYGEEPLSFYIKNLLLNWNILVFVIVLGIPYAVWRMLDLRRAESLKDSIERNSAFYLFAATCFLWLLIFGAQAHKEERFLFPIYPLIALLAAFVYDCIHEQLIRWKIGKFSGFIVSVVFVLCYVSISCSRVYSIHTNYEAHSRIYKELNKEFQPVNKFETQISVNSPDVQVCVGKEWHRFPSSFFIPTRDRDGRKIRMAFVRSEFRGLLPQPFKVVIHLIDSTRYEPLAMNDMNKEELSRYVSLNSCDYFIDVDMPATEFEPNLGEMTNEWENIASRKFIDLSKPAKYAGLLRAFYVPYFSAKENAMTNYSLYRKIVR